VPVDDVSGVEPHVTDGHAVLDAATAAPGNIDPSMSAKPAIGTNQVRSFIVLASPYSKRVFVVHPYIGRRVVPVTPFGERGSVVPNQ
jgi:hypothetical protein